MFETERLQAFRDIESLVKSSPIFMFIKGTLQEPKCKFTRRLIETMKPQNMRNLKTLNILENERIRQWLKFYSKWPTFPQIFINGSFVGGVDVVCDLITEGEFDEMIPDACRPLPPGEALKEFLKSNRLVCFIKGQSQDEIKS